MAEKGRRWSPYVYGFNNPTPHSRVYNKNMVNGVQKSITRATKHSADNSARIKGDKEIFGKTAMREIEVVTTELFKSLLEIDIDNAHFDLHNDYDCYSILLSKDHDLTLSLKSSDKEVKLVFKDSTMNYMAMNLSEVNTELSTIDSIYRGRYEDGKVLREVTDDSRSYYYIEFYSGYAIEFFARAVFFVTF